MSARKSDLLRLQAIVDCIEDVQETIEVFSLEYDNYVNPASVFEHTCRRSIDMLMLQMCEEAREVTSETRDRMSNIPWSAIAEVRNYFVHSYNSVDASAVWGFIEEDLPELRSACMGCIADIERGEYTPRFSSRTKEKSSYEVLTIQNTQRTLCQRLARTRGGRGLEINERKGRGPLALRRATLRID